MAYICVMCGDELLNMYAWSGIVFYTFAVVVKKVGILDIFVIFFFFWEMDKY